MSPAMVGTRRYTFRGQTGYLIAPQGEPGPLALGHTNSPVAWNDPHAHLHLQSEECYLLLQGELLFWVAGDCLSLQRSELLVVRPGVPHAILGGRGPVEHFGIRAPGAPDKQISGALPQPPPALAEAGERELARDWGLRIALDDHLNCWLLGYGEACFPSAHLILAYLGFSTRPESGDGTGHRHHLHYHQRSWEYYTVLEGALSLQIENEVVEAQAGEILAVPPLVRHGLYSRQTPFKGFTLRAPVVPGDKTEC